MSLKLDRIYKSFNGKMILTDLSLTAEQGERIVIYGSSGSGKSTLLRIIAGFIQPDQGTVEIEGAQAAQNGKCFLEPEHRRIGMVFQDLALWPHMSCYENIAFGLKARKLVSQEVRERTEAMLEKIRLSKHRDSLPGEISGGEQQRVAIARALVTRPKILLMDEPLSHLDEDLKSGLMEEILKLHQEFLPILLYVTHNQSEGVVLGSRFVSLVDGKIQ